MCYCYSYCMFCLLCLVLLYLNFVPKNLKNEDKMLVFFWFLLIFIAIGIVCWLLIVHCWLLTFVLAHFWGVWWPLSICNDFYCYCHCLCYSCSYCMFCLLCLVLLYLNFVPKNLKNEDKMLVFFWFLLIFIAIGIVCLLLIVHCWLLTFVFAHFWGVWWPLSICNWACACTLLGVWWPLSICSWAAGTGKQATLHLRTP